MTASPTTVGAVAGAVTALAGIAMWFLQRKSEKEKKASEPLEEKRRREERIAREVATDDEAGANGSLDDDLRRFNELRALPGGGTNQSDLRRPDGAAGQSGTIHDFQQ